MTFEDRGWARSFSSGGERGSATLWLLGILVGAHLLKALANAMNPAAGVFVHENLTSTADGLIRFQVWRPFTYMLLHADVMHLLWNAIILGFSGFALERIVGSMELLRVFVVSGVVGGLSVVVWALFGHPEVTSLGASGAINGLLVALAVLAPDTVVLLFFVIPIRLRWLVGGYVLIDVLKALGDGTGRPGSLQGSDVFCHLLGAATGLTMVWVVPRFVRPWWRARQHQRAKALERQIAEAANEEAQELDRILAKIAEKGMPSLTDAERATLKRESDRRARGR